jgi:hypothetical protein
VAYSDDYNIRGGIAYSKGDTYAHCDRCGFRPVVNHKCLKCDLIVSGGAVRLAGLIERFCVRKGGFDAFLAAEIIEACVPVVRLTQATNQDYE